MKKYKKYIISLIFILTFLISICFIPINATRFIPSLEKQVSEDLGIKIHIERLIFRFGPSLKVKAPTMHMMYEDGQKFGQFDNVKFFIPWTSLFKNDIAVKRIYADKFIVKVHSSDKYLPKLIETLNSKDFNQRPNIVLKAYSMSYNDSNIDKNYKITGSDLELSKVVNYKNVKIKAIGNFSINDKQYLSYDISVVPNIEVQNDFEKKFDFNHFINQLETMDFHSDIIADLRIYTNINNEPQISGLVNIDNISVFENKGKKCPKSFIYLTFLGNKTGVLSNIYAKENKKICIDGVISNSQKSELDLKVKTDELEIEELFPKIKLLVDCSKFKGIESIKGKLLADFNMKGDINKIKSNGYLKISDASIKASGVDINKINANVDFSNNVISINDAVGYVHDAPIMLKGKIDKKPDLELLMSKVELNHLFPAKYGIKSGIMSLSANITGTLDKITHKENLQIEKFSAQKDDNTLSFGSLKIDTHKENVAYVNNIVIKPKKTDVIKLPQLKLKIDQDAVKIPDTNIFMPNSHMNLKAEILNYNNNDLTFNTNLTGFVNSKDLSGMALPQGNYPLKINAYGNKEIQNIESQILLEKAVIIDEPGIINFVSKIDNNTLKIDDLSISLFNGVFSNNLKSNIKGQKKIVVSGNIENLTNPIFKNIRIYIPQQLNISVADTFAQLKGDVFINGNLNQPEVTGQISIKNLVNQLLQLAANNTVVDFNKNIAVINAPQIKLSDSSFSVNATVSTDFAKELMFKNLNIKSKYMNIDTLLMYKDTPLLKAYPVRITDGKFYADKSSVTVYGSPIHMSALQTDYKLSDWILTAKNTTAEMYNGKFAGYAEYNLKDDSFKSKIQARGISAAPIFDAVVSKKDSVSGTMDFDSNIQGNITTKQSLSGDVKFIVHNGHMGTLGKLEHLLYAQNVIADNMLRTSLSVVTKAITLKDTGLFKYLRGDIALKDGIANVRMMQSQGPQMSLFIKGQYNISNDYAKLTVLGRLSDEIVAGLGAFGEFSVNKLMIMLTGEDNAFNIVPEDIEKLPQLPMKNTKEFRSIINGIAEKPSSVIQFNWISYTKKSYRQKEVPADNTKVPDFIETLPY